MGYQIGYLKGSVTSLGGLAVVENKPIRPKVERLECCFCRAGHHRKCTVTLRTFSPETRGKACECVRCCYERRGDLL